MAHPKNRRKVIVFSVIGAVLVALTLAAIFKKKEPLITVQTEKVARRNITEIVVASGKIQPVVEVHISPEVSVAIVSSIALLAAGIGIMNIMLVSVTERTREIGIRRAIGAKKRNIMAQFIMEAVTLCEIGGSIGVVLGIIGGNATAYFLELPPVIPFDWVVIGLVVCSAVGIVFGTYPAYKAANLDPIESLRYE
jgi:putative ABC transport system permease protein